MGFFLHTCDDSFCGKLEITDCNKLVAVSGCHYSCLVTEILDISSTEAWGQGCHSSSIDLDCWFRIYYNWFQMHHEYLLPALYIRQINLNKPIKSSRTGESWIQDIFLVSSSKDNHIWIRLKTIHLDKQLIQCVISFVIASTKASRSFLPDCIDLVNEDNGWGCFSGLCEQIAHPLSTNSYIHFDELTTAYGEKGYITFTGTCFSNHSLSCTWRAG